MTISLDARKLRDRPGSAEILSDRFHWLVVEVMPGEESQVAAQLTARRYPVFIPGQYSAHGTWVPMFPGYVIVGVWGIERHRARVLSIDGVRDFLYEIGHPHCPFVVPDPFIDALRKREREEIERKLSHTEAMRQVVYGKKPKRRSRRRSPRIRRSTQVQKLRALLHKRAFDAYMEENPRPGV